jgi:hypothetical protein
VPFSFSLIKASLSAWSVMCSVAYLHGTPRGRYCGAQLRGHGKGVHVRAGVGGAGRGGGRGAGGGGSGEQWWR